MLLTVSEYSQKRIAFHYNIPVEKIGITPNGISKEFFEEKIGDNFRFNLKYDLQHFILYVSRIEPRKNHLILLKAFSDLKLWEKSYKLIFVGKKDFSYGDLDVFLESCTEKCRRNILFLQNINNSELISFYKNADLFIYPSIAEGFGIPPIEAISTGTPTLCSNATAMSDFAFLEEDHFDPNNLDELKLKIINKLTQPINSTRIDLLKRIVAEKYSWNKSAKKFISLLKDELQ